MTKRAIVLLALALAGILTLPARQNAAILQQKFAARISHYDIAAEIVPSKKIFSAKAILTLLFPFPGAAGGGAIRVFLHKEFTVQSVSSGGAFLTCRIPDDAPNELMYSPSARAVEIDLPRIPDRTNPER